MLRHRTERRHIRMRRAEHEGAQPVSALFPLLAGTLHVHGEDVVGHVASVHQGHHLALGQKMLETKVPVAARQRIAARADDQPADVIGDAIQVHGLHDGQLDQGISPRQHRQPRDLGARLRGHAARQHDAAFDDKGATATSLDAGGTDGLAGDLVAAQQHGGTRGAVHRLDFGEVRHRVSQMVAVGLGTNPAGLGQIHFGTCDENVETE